MKMYDLLRELESIHYKYERLTSLIGILQMIAAEMIEVAGVPNGSLSDALYEIELGMEENNNRLTALFEKKGDANG